MYMLSENTEYALEASITNENSYFRIFAHTDWYMGSENEDTELETSITVANANNHKGMRHYQCTN